MDGGFGEDGIFSVNRFLEGVEDCVILSFGDAWHESFFCPDSGFASPVSALGDGVALAVQFDHSADGFGLDSGALELVGRGCRAYFWHGVSFWGLGEMGTVWSF